jgi:hypothetical protein
MVGSQGSFDLLEIGIRGDTILKQPIAYEGRPITRADQEWLRDGFGRRMAGEFNSGPKSPFVKSDAQIERERQAAMDAIIFPEFFPPVRRVGGGHDGTIWVLRELRPDRADLWEIYDGSGRLEGSILIEEGRGEAVPWGLRMQLLRATRDELWGMTMDELDVPTVRRYRVKRTCG